MPQDPAFAEAKKKAKERFSFSEPENFFKDVKRGDVVGFVHAKDDWYKARLVEVEMIKMLRDRVEKCYTLDPVNHKQKCRKVILDYMGAWQNYRDHKAFLYTEGGNIDRFKFSVEEVQNFTKYGE